MKKSKKSGSTPKSARKKAPVPARPAAKIHQKSRVHSSRRASSRTKITRRFLLARRTILAVILLAMLSVILALLLTVFMNPERVSTIKIESIATDYYENHYYDRLLTYATTNDALESLMSRYTNSGFSKVTLKQLLLFDNKRHFADSDYLSRYCDLDATYIQIFPDSPFSRTDYHIDYHYACEF